MKCCASMKVSKFCYDVSVVWAECSLDPRICIVLHLKVPTNLEEDRVG